MRFKKGIVSFILLSSVTNCASDAVWADPSDLTAGHELGDPYKKYQFVPSITPQNSIDSPKKFIYSDFYSALDNYNRPISGPISMFSATESDEGTLASNRTGTNNSDYSYSGIAQKSDIQISESESFPENFSNDSKSIANSEILNDNEQTDDCEGISPSKFANSLASHITADKVIADDDKIMAEGNVAITIEQARLMCNSLTLDRLTGDIIATGDCLIYWENNYVAADWLSYSPQQRSMTIHNASGQSKGLGVGTVSNDQGLIFWADTMRWQKERTELLNATMTTCSNPTDDLHFKLKSEQITIYPSDRIIAKHSSIYAYGHHILTLPTSTFRLNEDKRMQRSFFPTIGTSKTNGAFIRTAVPYTIDKNNYGAVLLGYNTETSFSGGLEHCYRFSNKGQGVAYYYRQGNKSTDQLYEARNNVYYIFDDENMITWDFKANRSDPSNNELDGRKITSYLNFKHQTERDTLLLSHNFSSSNVNSYNHNWRLYYNVKLTPELAALVNADISNTVTSTTSGTRFHYAAGLRHTSEIFDTDLMVENTSGRSMYHLNRNPELTMRSHPIYIGDVPFMAMASFGNITEHPSDVTTTRTELSVQVPNQVFDYGTGKIFGGAGMRQIFYGTGHSMYALAAQTGWMQNLGNFGTVRLDYNWMQPTGETPIQHDLINGYSNLTGGMEFFHDDTFNLSVIGGYNLRSERFQNITPRLTFHPNQRWKFIVGSNFDPNDSQWRSLDTNLTFQLSDNLSISHWSVYDIINNRFTYQDYQLNLEGHDWITSLSYRSVQKELYFQFSLKAFELPYNDIGPDVNKAILPRTLPDAFTMH